jgi:hypothetical protein
MSLTDGTDLEIQGLPLSPDKLWKLRVADLGNHWKYLSESKRLETKNWNLQGNQILGRVAV